MLVTHAFSNTQADATGTATIWNGTTTSTIAATAVPRPSDWNSGHILAFTLTGNTINQSTFTGTQLRFSGAGGVQLGISNSSLIISGPPLATAYNEFKESPMVAGQVGQGSLHLQRWNMPDIQFDRVVMPIQASATTGQTGTVTLSFHVGIYTFTGSTLSLWGSTSGSTSQSFQGTGQNSLITGLRIISFPWTTTFQGFPGAVIGILSRTTTAGGAFSASQMLASQVNSGVAGFFGSTLTAGSAQLSAGHGVWTTTSTALPASVGVSDIRETASIQMRPPQIVFINGTF